MKKDESSSTEVTARPRTWFRWGRVNPSRLKRATARPPNTNESESRKSHKPSRLVRGLVFGCLLVAAAVLIELVDVHVVVQHQPDLDQCDSHQAGPRIQLPPR